MLQAGHEAHRRHGAEACPHCGGEGEARCCRHTAEEDTDEQAYFDRIGTFQDRNREFVQTAASAVGAEENGHWPSLGAIPPDGSWEAKVVRMLKQGFYPNGLVEFQEDRRDTLRPMAKAPPP